MWRPYKVISYIIMLHIIFHFLWNPGYLKNRIPLQPALGGVCSLANYSVAYEETQSNRVSDFRAFVGSLFQKATLLTFILLYCSLTQSNRISNFRDFVCSLFQRQSFLTFKTNRLIEQTTKQHRTGLTPGPPP